MTPRPGSGFQVVGTDGWSSAVHPTAEAAKREALCRALPADRHDEVGTAGVKALDRLWSGAHAMGYRLMMGV